MRKTLEHPFFLFLSLLFFVVSASGFLANRLSFKEHLGMIGIGIVIAFIFANNTREKEDWEERIDKRRRRREFVYKMVCMYALRSEHDYDLYCVDSLFPDYTREDLTLGWRDYQDELEEIALSRCEQELIRASAAGLLFSCYELTYSSSMMRVALDSNPVIRDAVARGWFFFQEKMAKDEERTFVMPSIHWIEYVKSCFSEDQMKTLLAFASDKEDRRRTSATIEDNSQKETTA